MLKLQAPRSSTPGMKILPFLCGQTLVRWLPPMPKFWVLSGQNGNLRRLLGGPVGESANCRSLLRS